MATRGLVRKPRGWLIADGQPINLMNFEAHLTRAGTAAASTAEITMALDDPSNPGPRFWSTGGLIPASLMATNGDRKQTTATLLEGFIDYAHVDFGTRTVIAHMVDKSTLFVQTRSDAKWSNMTTSDIAAQLAAEHGLQAHTDQGDMAGTTFDGQEFTFLSDYENSWDVIQTLAHEQGYVAFVQGNTLYFVDPGNVLGNNYVVHYTPPTAETYDRANAVQVKCIHNFMLGQGVQYGVASWHTYDNQSYTAMAGSGSVQGFERKGGLTMEQVQHRANIKARYAQMHEYTVEVEMRGDVIVQPTMMLQLSGTDSNFDMTYYMDTVVHRMDDHGGYDMEITGYNGPPGDAGYLPNIYNQLSVPQNPQQQTNTPGFDMLGNSGAI